LLETFLWVEGRKQRREEGKCLLDGDVVFDAGLDRQRTTVWQAKLSPIYVGEGSNPFPLNTCRCAVPVTSSSATTIPQ